MTGMRQPTDMYPIHHVPATRPFIWLARGWDDLMHHSAPSLAYGVMCTGFVATVHTLGGDRRVQWLAAIVVLSHPMLNHTRSAIMRWLKSFKILMKSSNSCAATSVASGDDRPFV